MTVAFAIALAAFIVVAQRIAQNSSSVFELPIEAEEGELLGFETVDDVTASGKRYIVGSVDGVAVYRFSVPEDGTYVAWARVDSLGYDGSNSFFVRIDGGQRDVWDLYQEDDPPPDGWGWERISARCGGDFNVHNCEPLPLTLRAGRHVLEIAAREPATRLDTLVITSELDTLPLSVRSSASPLP